MAQITATAAASRKMSQSEVYGVLGDEASRRDYDAYLRGELPNRPAPLATPPPVDLSSIRAGVAPFDDLPRATRERLYRRVTAGDLPGVRVPLGGMVWPWVFVLAATGWFFYLLSQVSGPRWDDDFIFDVICISGLAALFLGPALASIDRWIRYPLGRNLLVTPLYVIRIHYEKIAYWPLWAISDFKATNHFTNGSYSSTKVRFLVAGAKLEATFSKYQAFTRLLETLNGFQQQNALAVQRSAWTYFFANDDFRDVPVAPPRLPVRWWTKPVRFLGGTVIGAAILVLCFCQANQRLAGGSETASIAMQSSAQPFSGDTILYVRHPATVPVEVHAPAQHACLISFRQPSDKVDVLSVYIRRGESAKVAIPVGIYQVELAAGDDWRDYASLFGDQTVRRSAIRLVIAGEPGPLHLQIDPTLFAPL